MTLRLDLDDRPEASDGLLAAVSFGREHAIGDDPRALCIGMPPLDGSAPVECWRTDGAVECGRHGDIAYAGDGRVFFGHLLLDEGRGGGLEAIGHHGYRLILDWLEAFGGLHLLRIWNYVHDINRLQDGLERYRAFCVGRARALADREFAERSLPAATGIGAAAPGLMISFIAASTPGMQIENPRQVSAFHYPRRYGPRSPSFSRALLHRPDDKGENLLFVSGTASIVGHETLHAESPEDQCAETFRNLDAVIEAAGGRHRFQALRVYIRHQEQTEAILACCRRHFGDAIPIIPLASAICRRELLVEIEGIAGMRTAGSDRTPDCR